MSCNYYYNSNAVPPDSGVVDKNWVAYYGGIDPDTATPAELAAAGFYCYISAEIPVFNYLIYSLEETINIVGTNAEQAYTVVPLPLGDASSYYNLQVTGTMVNLLSGTDWLVIREVEDSTPIPTDWATWRADVRTEAQTKHDAIGNCADAAELDAYVNSTDYTTWPTEPTVPPV